MTSIKEIGCLENDGYKVAGETIKKPSPRRPPPLKIPEKVWKTATMSEIPKNMVEWHGILIPIDDINSPITPSHWTIRIEDPIIRKIYMTVLSTLSQARIPDLRWHDLGPTEFLPGLYLGSYYDLFNIDHKVRVSILEDFSLLRFFADKTDTDLDAKLEINANDDDTTNIMIHFNEFRDFLDGQPEDNIKFIHCVAGMNRSATLATAYYMHKTGCDLIKAIHHMVKLRPIILQNENFIKQLIVWAFDNNFAKY